MEEENKLYAFLSNLVNQAEARMGYPAGYANGYVALPPTHPFHNIYYSEIDEHVSVHGGLTFSQSIDIIKQDKDWEQCTECIGFESLNEIPAGYWVVGFDTMRFSDGGLNRDWCIEETLRLKKQLEALTGEQPRTAAEGKGGDQ